MTEYLPYLQTILAACNITIIAYTLFKFLRKPHDTVTEEVSKLRQEVIELKLEIKGLKESMDTSFEKHREQGRTNAVFKRVFMLLANFEVAYCQETGYLHTEDLREAKKELEEYLAGM